VGPVLRKQIGNIHVEKKEFITNMDKSQKIVIMH